MKRFLSILIALILVLSLFAVNIVAFADDEATTNPGTEQSGSAGEGEGDEEEDVVIPHAEVGFNWQKYQELFMSTQRFEIEMSENFMLDIDWLYDAELVREIFPGIIYNVWPKEDLEEKTEEFTLTFDLNGIPESSYMGYYCEKDDTYYIEHELDEGKCPDCGGDVVWKRHKEYESVDYKETQHIKLPSAPVAPSGQKFGGWELISDGLPTWREGVLYKASTEIAMPADDMTVKAVWVDIEEELKDETPDDVIYVLYCNTSRTDPREEMEDWSHCSIKSNFSVTTEGWWYFRFAVLDGANANKSNYSFDWEDVLATTYDNVQDAIDDDDPSTDPDAMEDLTLRGYAVDTTRPIISLSKSMEDKHELGIIVGTKYNISTSLEIEDCSGTTVNYVVYKLVNKAWVQIYDSSRVEEERVVEGYEDFISKDGAITPVEDDVTGEYIYKIVYTVVDDWGNVGVREDDSEAESVELLLKVVREEKAPAKTDPVEVWKIVLYVVAGLSAVGIVVLLLIKPKKEAVADGRYNVKADEGGEQPDGNEPKE